MIAVVDVDNAGGVVDMVIVVNTDVDVTVRVMVRCRWCCCCMLCCLYCRCWLCCPLFWRDCLLWLLRLLVSGMSAMRLFVVLMVSVLVYHVRLPLVSSVSLCVLLLMFAWLPSLVVVVYVMLC